MNINIREEKLINYVAGGMPQFEAYKKAGYEGSEANCSALVKKLKENGKFEKVFKSLDITKEKLLEELKKDILAEPTDELKRKDKHKAIELAGKFRGDFVEKHEVKVNELEGEVRENVRVNSKPYPAALWFHRIWPC